MLQSGDSDRARSTTKRLTLPSPAHLLDVQERSCDSLSQRLWTLLNNDVDQAIGYDDQLGNLFSVYERFYFVVCQRQTLQFFPRSTERDVDVSAQLAVHLNRNLGELVLCQDGIKIRPRMAEDRPIRV